MPVDTPVTSLAVRLALAGALCALSACQKGGVDGAAVRSASGGEASGEIISTTTGDSPNFSQLSNGRMMTVVSRDVGRGATPGALVELFYPHYATDHLWDAYVGVRLDKKLQWAQDLKLVRQALVPDHTITTTEFKGSRYGLLIEDVVRPDADAHLRRVTVTNTSAQPLAGASVAAYAFFTLNHLPTGDRLRYLPGEQAFVQSDAGVSAAWAVDVSPTAWQVGTANIPLGASGDARLAAERGELSNSTSLGAQLAGVNGALSLPLPTLAPGAKASFTLAYAVGPDDATALGAAQTALKAGFASAAEADGRTWSEWLASSNLPANMPADVREAVRRAMIVIKQHQADNGAIIAAPTNLNPPYRFVWPRDGSTIALTMLETGHADEARRFFEFLERLQLPTGGFAINYFPDASRALWNFGTNGNEHDQVGTFVWGVDKLDAAAPNPAWLSARYGAVRKACDFLLSVQRPDGLLGTCRDLWELADDGTWTFSNAAGWAGLDAGARIAERLGRSADVERYRTAAARLRQALGEKLIQNGAFVRGERKGRLDPAVEAANLALGSQWFGTFPDNDPRLQASAKQVEARLSTPWGGIRRYENDQYYNGQPWPVSTAWLAMHRANVGDAAGARALFDTMTRYAHETDSLMLGEQYDERKRVWRSAFPLVWSEAAYVRTARRLFR